MSEEVCESGEIAGISTSIGHKVVCRVCGKEFKRIYAMHLKTHGMSIKEYLELYPDTRNDLSTSGQFTAGTVGLYKDKTWADVIGTVAAEKQRIKFREIAVERYKAGILKPKISRPHKALMELLTLHNVPFECEYHVGMYAADIAILDANVLVEVDGTYFHNKAAVPFEELDAIQQKTARNDSRKALAFKDAGWQVLHVWQDEIYNSTTEVVNRILTKIGRNRVYSEPDTPADSKCQVCGKPMSYARILSKSKYCCKDCCCIDRRTKKAIIEQNKKIICANCGMEFTKGSGYSEGSKYCSDSCRKLARKRRMTEVYADADFFKQRQESAINSEYNKRRREEGRVLFTCPCGKESWKPKCHARGKMLYCSGACYHKYMFENKENTNNPLYQEKECQSQ